MPIKEVASIEFDNTQFVDNIKESIALMQSFESTEEAVQATTKALQASLNNVSAAKPLKEFIGLKKALQDIALPGQSLANFEKIFTGAADDVQNLKVLLSGLKGELKNALNDDDAKLLAKAINETEKAIKQFDDATDGAAKSATTLKQDYRSALNDLQRDLKATGGVWTKELINKAKELGEQKDEIGDLQNIIKNFSSDSFKIDVGVQGIQAGISAMQLYVGVMELAGLNTEDYQKTIAKLTALQGIASGVQQLYNALQKDSALLLGLTQIKTNLVSAAQAAYTVVVGASTGALKAFRIALAATGIGAIVVLLGLAADAMGLFDSETKAVIETQDELKKKFEEQDEVINAQIKNIERLAAARKNALRRSGAKDESLALVDIETLGKEKALLNNQLNELAKDFNKYEKIKADNYSSGSKQYEAAAQAQADISKKYSDIQNKILDIDLSIDTKRTDLFVKSRENKTKVVAKEKKQAEKEFKDLLQIRIEAINKQRQIEVNRIETERELQKKETIEKVKDATERAKLLEKIEESSAFLISNVNLEKNNLVQDALNNTKLATKKTKEDIAVELSELNKTNATLLAEQALFLNPETEPIVERKTAQKTIDQIRELRDIENQIIADKDAEKANLQIRNANDLAKRLENIELDRQERDLNIRKEYEVAKVAIATATGIRLTEIEKANIEKQLAEIDKLLAELGVKRAKVNSETESSGENLTNEQKIDATISAYDQVATAVINTLSAINKAEQDSLNRSIAIQEKRVSSAQKLAERGNAEYLQLEEDRLNELEKKREDAARKQLAIDSALQASQILVAVAGAAAQIAKAEGTFGVIAGIAAIVAALGSGAALVANLQSQRPTLYDGTEYLQRGKNPKGKDTIPIMAHEGERVVPSYINEKLFGIKNKHLPELVALGLGKVAPPKINYKDLVKAVTINNQFKMSSAETNKELREMKTLLAAFVSNQSNTFVSAKADPNKFIEFQIEYEKNKKLRNNA